MEKDGPIDLEKYTLEELNLLMDEYLYEWEILDEVKSDVGKRLCQHYSQNLQNHSYTLREIVGSLAKLENHFEEKINEIKKWKIKIS